MKTKLKTLRRKQAQKPVKKTKLITFFMIFGACTGLLGFSLYYFLVDIYPIYKDAVDKATLKDWWPTGVLLSLGLLIIYGIAWYTWNMAKSINEVLKQHFFGEILAHAKPSAKLAPKRPSISAKGPAWWGNRSTTKLERFQRSYITVTSPSGSGIERLLQMPRRFLRGLPNRGRPLVSNPDPLPRQN